MSISLDISGAIRINFSTKPFVNQVIEKIFLDKPTKV